MVEGTTQVIRFLLGHRDIYICEACIAFALEVSVSQVRKVTARLARNDEFDRRAGQCTVCARDSTIVAARP